MSALPYICAAVMALCSGQIADFIRSRGILNTTQTRRLFQGIGNSNLVIYLKKSYITLLRCNIFYYILRELCNCSNMNFKSKEKQKTTTLSEQILLNLIDILTYLHIHIHVCPMKYIVYSYNIIFFSLIYKISK